MTSSGAASATALPARAGVLRFITCGSVDDGKSTLIGRMLHDCGLIADDQMAALAADSRRFGTQGQALDFALLVDGLSAEREQAITIDVAYRYFATPKRSFIVADTPGHEHFTRNMATGASTADLAIVLVDATKGIIQQTRRHAFIVHLMGLRHIVLCVNKMDLVDWSEERFTAICAEFAAFAADIGLYDHMCVPISALSGANVAGAAHAPEWWRGPSLLDILEIIDVDDARLAQHPFRMPVQNVSRPNPAFRGYAGMIASGIVRVGDPVRILPSGRNANVARIVTMDGDLEGATAGQSVTLSLTQDIDCSRGDVIAAAADAPAIADQFEAHLIWMADEKLLPGRTYILKCATQTVNAQITEIKHKADVSTLAQLAAKSLALNDIALVNLSLDRPIAFEAYADNPCLGGFILIDRMSNATLAAGMIRFALRRAANISWQALDVTRETRAAQKGQRQRVVWFTGLSGSGKSTIANALDKMLTAQGRHVMLLDGDNVRHGLNRDLGFTEEDRVENIRRVAETAKLMADAGLIVLVSFISPFRAERAMARALMAQGEFLEVFVDTPLSEAEKRDVKGLYRKARSGLLKNFTGIDSPYEAPETPDLRIDTTRTTADAAAEEILRKILEN